MDTCAATEALEPRVANGERRNQYTSNTTAFRIYGRGCNDVIHTDIVESISLPGFLFGGPGADTVTGGGGGRRACRRGRG